MSHSRAFALLLATVSLLAASLADAQIGILPLPDQDIPSGKTLVVPIPATDPGGPARSYTVTVGAATTSGSATTVAGVTAAIRTGDPHFILGVSYTDSNSVMQTGTMEFQLLREFTPLTTQIIGGLTQGGFYSPQTTGTGTKYVTFHRVVAGFVIQGGDPNGNGSGGPGFTFPNEFSSALIFSGTAGQLAMANSGNGAASGSNGTNGSQFFITLASDQADLDYTYNLFGQLLRGYDTLFGIAGTAVVPNGSGEDSSPVNPVDITSATVSQNDTDAVLLLSATGVCDAPITVTASSGTASTVQTFTAHAVADTNDDPPFLLPVPDITAPNGSVKVLLQGIDLQLDLLRYGYQRILPVMDSSVTSGTSPLVSIPLISNTDNTIAAALDHWNATKRGFDERVFHAGAGDKPLRGSLTPIAPGRFGSLLLTPYPVAVFTSGNSKDTAASFTASVNWGDGTFLSGTEVSIVKDSGSHRFQVVAGHDYKSAGEYPLIVKIADAGGAHLLLTGTENIGPSSIAISGTDISRTDGILKNQVLATFDDSGAASTPADYSAIIDWGDGSVSPGTVKSGRDLSYKILGSHAYQTPNTFTVSATVTRSGSNTASEWSTARIAGVTAPQVFPPFPQAHLAQVWSTVYSDSTSILGAEFPYAGLVQGTDGSFYGTTTQGGGNTGAGTVFQITASGSLTTLYAFTGASDGGDPHAGLVQGTDGNFYGTTGTDGSGGAGTVFQITPGGSLTTLYSFTGGNDGGNPEAALAPATGGIFLGTTETDGSDGAGTVFQITASGSLTTLYTFTGGSDGANPYGTLVSSTGGIFFGTTEAGGSNGYGTVFQITASGSLTTLYAFTGAADGGHPYAGLVTGTGGNLYGTTETGGSDSAGTVFQITTSGSLNTLYEFTGGNDGANPYAALIQGADGNLYGTTETDGGNGAGTVFQITTGGSLNTLFSFTGGGDGGNPYAALVQGTGGELYGTTLNGGVSNAGTVYQTTTSGSFASLVSFTGTTFQISVRAAVEIVNSGNKASAPGSFAVYVDPNGTLDSEATQFTSNGQSSFPIPALGPGKSVILPFQLEGTVVDTRLKLPIGFDPTGQSIIGVVTYSDPVGDFDGSQKIISPGSF